MRVLAKERAKDRIAELSRRGYDLVTFWRECTQVLKTAVPTTTRRAGTRWTRHRF